MNTIKVDNVVYSMDIADIHSGGSLFVELFQGQDATHAFRSYHRRNFPHEKMKSYKLETIPETVENDPDYMELCEEIQKVLPTHKSFAPLQYYAKCFFLLFITFALEYHIHSNGYYNWYNMILLGWLFSLVGLNIQHDANHGAISKHFWVNRIMGMSQNWIGGSAIDWMHQHVVQHHIHCNNVEKDPDIAGNHLLRLNPLKPLIPHHLFQCFYFTSLLSLFGISYSVQSFINIVLMKNNIPYSNAVQKYIPLERTLTGLSLSRWIILPFLFSESSLLYTYFNVILMFSVGGFYLSFFFILSHNYQDVLQYSNDTKSFGFLKKQVLTSSNVGGEWLAFLNGGLNYQIEHHLFPRINHSHYPFIAPYVEAFCKKKDIQYVHFPTIKENYLSCMYHLLIMGTNYKPPNYIEKRDKDKDKEKND